MISLRSTPPHAAGAPPQRPQCGYCLRPVSACLCRWVTPTPSACEVLILQHPLEVAHAKNTARLLHLSLPSSRLVVGEAFDAATLQALLPANRINLLLYPPTRSEGHAEPAVLDPAALTAPDRLRLVVLDATWRKSRKMLHLSPGLQSLPRLALEALPPSRYAIRKAQRPGQLSTLEASCTALAQLESNAERWQPLLAAFDAWVAQQQAYVSN